MARASGSVSACRQFPANNMVDRTSRLNRSFISSPVIRPRLGGDAQIVVPEPEPGSALVGMIRNGCAIGNEAHHLQGATRLSPWRQGSKLRARARHARYSVVAPVLSPCFSSICPKRL